jgi:arylsulfatase A
MNVENKYAGVSLAGSLLFSAVQPLMAQADETKQYNVILIMADDVSAKEFSLYEPKNISTPNLDRMGRDGMYFRTAWATPICSPSRALIMTGKYASKTKIYHNNIKPESFNLGRDHLTFGELLKTAGYQTAFVGKVQMEGDIHQEYGFDETYEWADWDGFDGPVEIWDKTKGPFPDGMWPGRTSRYWHPAIKINGEAQKTGPQDYGPDILVDHILSFVSRNKKQPFFVYYPMLLPHKSWDFERKQSGYIPVPVRDESGKWTGKKSEPTLKSNVQYMDYLVNRIKEHVIREGLAENTVIMYTGDNGTDGYGKCWVAQERGPRVPFIVWGPGVVKKTGASDALMDFSDVLPTLADLAGVSVPSSENVDGVSFLPVLRGDCSSAREWILSYYGPWRMIRTQRWLLDGRGRFFDCGELRDEQGYRDVTDSDDPEVAAAKERLQSILDKRFPLDDFESDPVISAKWKKVRPNFDAGRQKQDSNLEKFGEHLNYHE